MSGNRRVEKNGVLNQSAQEESLRLKHKGKNPMEGVSKSTLYPYRPGELDCSYYLRTGSCGYGSNCRFNHPDYVAQGGQYREENPERIRQTNCVYFLKTGTCKYGSTCKYRHPKDMNGAGPVSSNILGLPMRQVKISCPYYMRTGSCRFGVACKFHHHQSASPGAGNGILANGPVGSAILPPSGVPRAPYASGSRLQMDQIEEDQSEFRGWDALIPEILGLIFSDLSLEELLTVIPCVCKSWRNVVTGPYCWQEIDIELWSKHCMPHHVDRMLRMLIKRSSGSLRKLCVSGLQNDSIFSFITKNASSLQVLRLPGSEMRGSVVEQDAKRLSKITLLDLSYCSNIGSRALESIGKQCKFLVTLCRNVEPYMLLDEPMDSEANAIAATMPGLKHLEMVDHEISTGGVMNILSGCPQLEFLDIRGCCDVELDNDFLKEKFPKLKVVGPSVTEDSDDREWNEDVDFDADSDFDPWDPDYLDYDDYTDPFHPDHQQNYDEYEFMSEFFNAGIYGRMFG